MSLILRRTCAAVALAGILVGLPMVLLALNAGPLDWPSWDTIRATLTSPDDGTVLLTILKAAGWLVWAALTLSITLEAAAHARGATAPQLPGLALPQRLARTLIGAVALSALAVPAAATAAPSSPSTVAVAATAAADTRASTPAAASSGQPTTSTPPAATPSAPATPTTPDDKAAAVTHTVVRGDTLWALAERYLGAGRRFPEIIALNADHLAAGRGDFLRPGWTLRIPAPPAAAGGAYTVQAGDTLSGIAQRLLGDPARYREILDASRGTTQPDGHRLTDPDQIMPGWTLTIPPNNPTAAATAPEPSPPAPQTQPEQPAAAEPAPEPTPSAPAPAAPPPSPSAAASAPSSSTSAPQTPAAAEVDDDTPWAPILPIGVGTVLAAGVVTLLNRRRADQQRIRRAGQRLPEPATGDQQLERALRAGENPLDHVDAALRGLAAHFRGATLPTVRAARVTPTHLDLYLQTPATLPDPWTTTGDTTVWTTPLTPGPDTTLASSESDVGEQIPAPWPTLVTIGRDDEDGYVLLDLETLGGLTITPGAHPDRARDILTALAVDLATSRWADDLRVTIVGACADLEDALQTGRIRYVPVAARVIDELENRAAADEAALTRTGTTSLQQARAQDRAPDAWSPDILVTAAPVTDSQRQRLTTLLQRTPRTAIAALTLDAPVSDWALELDAADPDIAVLQPIGLRIHPQHLPRASYRALLAVADLTNVAEVVTVEDQAPADALTAATAIVLAPPAAAASPTALPDIPSTTAATDHPTSDDTETDTETGEGLGPVTINVLGPISLTGARGTCDPSRRARLTELAVYLALHPGASHTDIDDAIWPNRKSEDNTATRHPVATRLRNWLGLSDDGVEFFPRHQGPETGYVLHDVRTDVAQWDDLVQRRPLAASTESLTAALALVRGRPFTGQRIRYYAWADPIKQRLIAEIVDASYEVGRRRYMAGDYRGCEHALAVGLDIDPGQERLHRLRILACHDARDLPGRQEAVDRLLVIADELDCELEPATEDFLADLSDPARLDDARTAI